MRWVAEGKERVDHFLANHWETVSRNKITKLIDAGEVLVNGVAVTKGGYSLRPGDTVDAELPIETPPHALVPVEIPLRVAYEDEYLLVVDKPRGLAVHPSPKEKGPTLVHALLARGHGLSELAGTFRPGIVHRLDKDTTGLLIVAKNDQVHAALSDQIKQRLVERRYVAVIRSTPTLDRFTIDAAIGRDPAKPTMMAIRQDGRRAVTHVKSIRRIDKGTLVSCRLETGRTHQIRVHLAHFGYDVLGDRLYARPPHDIGVLQLHAALLRFQHPMTHQEILSYLRPPEDFFESEFIQQSEVEGWT